MRRPAAPVDGRTALLAALSEDAWSAQVADWALRGGWCGVHIRRSLTTGRGYSVLRGIHTLRNSDHEDGRGLPDWLLARPGAPLEMAELKTVSGRFEPDQRRWQAVLNLTTGVSADLWRPTDGELVRELLLTGHRP